MSDFLTWIGENQIDNPLYRRTPQEGDIIITATKTFFRGPKARSFFKTGNGPRRKVNEKMNQWYIVKVNHAISGLPSYEAVYVPNPSKKMSFNLSEIGNDVTNEYPSEDRYGKNVWLYIPQEDKSSHAKYSKKMMKKENAPTDYGYSLLGESRYYEYY